MNSQPKSPANGTQIIFGLGSNLGDRAAAIRRAYQLLCDDANLQLTSPVLSPLYESPALLPDDAPDDWNIPFLNAVMIGYSSADLVPEQLLALLRRVEQALGKQKRGHWGPREIDVDVLAWGDAQVDHPSLTIPHARMMERDFVLLPLVDIAPNWQHPSGTVLADALDAFTIEAKRWEG